MFAKHPLHFSAFLLFSIIICLVCSCSSQHETEPPQEVSAPLPLPDETKPAPAELDIIFEEPELPSPEYIQPEEKTIAENEITVQQIPAEKKRPEIAIIIDDMGYHQKLGNSLLDLEMELTFSFLPYAPFTKELEKKAAEKGKDILIHIPMEPKDKRWNPGKGALYVTDSQEDIMKKIQDLIALVPNATGANNHMGSKFTENREAMTTVLEVLQVDDFFFIDSFTTAKSTGLEEAKRLKIPTARRHIFLDNLHNPDKICLQIEKLIQLAHKDGWAIAIGHPNKATLIALTQCDRNLLKSVDIVGVSTLIKSL